MQVKWNDFKIVPIIDSAIRINMSDEEYFSKKYAHYISNSKLKYINPDQEGSPQSYFEGMKQESTPSLAMGSAVHQLFLQPDEFFLVKGLQKPSAKAGQVVEKVKKYRTQGYSIFDSIYNSAQDVGYYASSLTVNRIKEVIKKGLFYYMNSKELGPQHVVLTDKETETCERCLNSLNSNRKIVNLVNGIDWAGDPTESNNEDALFMDIKVTYKDKEIILPLKMKADNWTIDTSEKRLVLNDLKTTGKPLPFFMQDYGSFVHFHYARQMAMYSWILKCYCSKEYGFDKSWTCDSNMIVVETIPPNRAGCFYVSPDQIKEGMIELFRLLKMVAYYELHGFEEEVQFGYNN